MLRIYVRLFEQLNQEIPYVVWKACHELRQALGGKGDIDLLVEFEYQQRFREIMFEYGFVHAQFNLLNFPFIDHYYAHDNVSGKICHLHIYFKIVTGESHLKSYHIPIEHEVIGNRFLNSLNLYEPSYSDQALMYSMRHYMKRASLIGFFFWLYEKKDYFEEYDYIKRGLKSAGREDSYMDENRLYSLFNFHSIDMTTGVSGYSRAKDKILSISGFRRFSTMEAAWKSLYNFNVRLFFKAFQIKKKFDCGIVLAISGVDGSGKSSMVKELHDWLGKHFDVAVLHLGRPSPNKFTFMLRPLLFLYRVIKGKNRNNINNSTDCSKGDVLKKKDGFIWSIRYLALAFERYVLAHKAQALAGKGTIVICDRYPTFSHGKMDSPRIEPGGSRIVEIMRHYEQQFYERLPKANGLMFLDVSMEEAVNRNRARIKKDKETDDEIIFRHKNNQGLDFSAEQVDIVDANRDYDSVLKSLKSISWKFLLVKNQ